MKQAIKIVFLILFGFSAVMGHSSSQVKKDSATKPMIYDYVDEFPSFEGSDEDYYKFLASHIHYPPRAIDLNAQGTVIIGVVIDKSGKLIDANIKKDGVGSGCGEEALRVIKLVPRWKPGKIQGNPVTCRYFFPVKFVLH
jgi:protein TonB